MSEEANNDPLSRPCPFITFYSFKGGVGRSMALINVAGILAARGFRVLVIDMDLEAPGLSFLARRADAEGQEPPKQDGFVDCLLDAKERGEEADLFARPPGEAIDRFCAPYELPPNLEPREGATLHIMPAGRLDDGYAKRLEQLDLAGLYREGLGLALVMTFKEIVQTGGRFDYVFIDSRTGFSDESGICTRDLADALVVLSGLNTQNVQGTSRFFGALRRALAQRELPRPKVAVVLSPVPNGEDELVDERVRAAVEANSAAWGLPVDADLHVPYHPRLALTEQSHVSSHQWNYLFESYRRIERRLRQNLSDTVHDWCARAEGALDDLHYDAGAAYLQRARKLAETEVWADRVGLYLASRPYLADGASEIYGLIATHASAHVKSALADSLGERARTLEKHSAAVAEALYQRALQADPMNEVVRRDLTLFNSNQNSLDSSQTLLAVRPVGICIHAGRDVDELASVIRDEIEDEIRDHGALSDFIIGSPISDIGRLAQAIQTGQYSILQIIAHGDDSGFNTSDVWGAFTVPPENLARLLRGSSIRIVIFASCQSDILARRLLDEGGVDVTISLGPLVTFATLRAFTVAFFRALSRGRTVQRAFMDGQAQAALRDGAKTDQIQIACRMAGLARFQLLEAPTFYIVGNASPDHQVAAEQLRVRLAPYRAIRLDDLRVRSESTHLANVDLFQAARVLVVLLDENTVEDIAHLETVAIALAEARNWMAQIVPLYLTGTGPSQISLLGRRHVSPIYLDGFAGNFVRVVERLKDLLR